MAMENICKHCNQKSAEIMECKFCENHYCIDCIKKQPSTPCKDSIFLSKYFPPIQICTECFLDKSEMERNRVFINNTIKEHETNWIGFWNGRWPYHFLFCGEVWAVWSLYELWTQMFQNRIQINSDMDNISIRRKMQRIRKIKISDYSDLHIDAQSTLSLLMKYISRDLSQLLLEYLIHCDQCNLNKFTNGQKFDNKYMNVQIAAQLCKSPDCNIVCYDCYQDRELCEFCLVEYAKNELMSCYHDGCDIKTCRHCCQSFQALEHEENCLVWSKYEQVQQLMLHCHYASF